MLARQPHVLARRALKIYWFRARVDGVLAGRAQSEASRPPARGTAGRPGGAGVTVALRKQRVMTRAVEPTPCHAAGRMICGIVAGLFEHPVGERVTPWG